MSLSFGWLTQCSRLYENREMWRSALCYGPYSLPKNAVQAYIYHWWPSMNWTHFQYALIYQFHYYTRPLNGGINRCFCLTSDLCLSCTFILTREQRGLGRLKLAQRYPTSHETRTPLLRSKGQKSLSPGRFSRFNW